MSSYVGTDSTDVRILQTSLLSDKIVTCHAALCTRLVTQRVGGLRLLATRVSAVEVWGWEQVDLYYICCIIVQYKSYESHAHHVKSARGGRNPMMWLQFSVANLLK